MLQTTLYRAAAAANDDPRCYSFALIETREITALNGEEDGVLYFSEGLAALPPAPMDALVAREVARRHRSGGGAGRAGATQVSAARLSAAR